LDKTIGGNLDDSITIRTIHSHDTYSGTDDVEDYFEDQFTKDDPHFDPGEHYRVTVNGTQGTVQGTGRWKDGDSHGQFQPLNYVF
jgi:hypothetical protein